MRKPSVGWNVWISHLPKKTISQFTRATNEPAQPAEKLRIQFIIVHEIVDTTAARHQRQHQQHHQREKPLPCVRPTSVRPFISCSKWLYSPSSWIKYICTHIAHATPGCWRPSVTKTFGWYWWGGEASRPRGAWSVEDESRCMRTAKAEKTTTEHKRFGCEWMGIIYKTITSSVQLWIELNRTELDELTFAACLSVSNNDVQIYWPVASPEQWPKIIWPEQFYCFRWWNYESDCLGSDTKAQIDHAKQCAAHQRPHWDCCSFRSDCLRVLRIHPISTTIRTQSLRNCSKIDWQQQIFKALFALICLDSSVESRSVLPIFAFGVDPLDYIYRRIGAYHTLVHTLTHGYLFSLGDTSFSVDWNQTKHACWRSHTRRPYTSHRSCVACGI